MVKHYGGPCVTVTQEQWDSSTKKTNRKERTDKKKKKKEKEKSEVVHTKWKNATVMHKKRGWDNKTHAREITN